MMAHSVLDQTKLDVFYLILEFINEDNKEVYLHVRKDESNPWPLCYIHLQ